MVRWVVSAALILWLPAAGCAPAEPSSRRVAVPDGAGRAGPDDRPPRPVTLPPKRIATH
jgi:hypothetical protein